MSTYAIGDIQGCYEEFQQLLSAINYKPEKDRLWLLGDIINRGPRNLETVDFIMSAPNVETVLGNHDLHFLALATTSRSQSRSDTLDDLLGSQRLQEIVDWMRRLPLILHSEEFDCTIVHAGIPPIWSINDALSYAAEVEDVLRSDEYPGFFNHMYGDSPARWSEDLEGWDRLRLITNCLTRIRYCNNQGELELQHKADIAPRGYLPWYSIPRPEKDTIIFGHWAAIEGITNQPNIIALDTGCVWGRKLTAYRLEDKRLFSVAASTSAQDD